MITQYGIRVTNPDTGISCFFNGWNMYPTIPSFSSMEMKLFPFRSAAALANVLRQYYPIVTIFGYKPI